MTDSHGETPTREAVICTLLAALLHDECASVIVDWTMLDSATGLVSHALHVEEAPREWFYESAALMNLIDDALDAIAHTDEPAWVAYFVHPQTPAEPPFQRHEVLLHFTDPSDGAEVLAVGSVAEGWCLIAESTIGEYSDNDADAFGCLTLHFGRPCEIERIIGERSTCAVEAAWSLVQDLLRNIPLSHQDSAKNVIAARAAALL